uniref:Uncharacterized protein n=1 Tax=Arundo donax TaxID=35708 RepID=A0A0A9DXS2_ARUDO
MCRGVCACVREVVKICTFMDYIHIHQDIGDDMEMYMCIYAPRNDI